jgi:hypothetical protein
MEKNLHTIDKLFTDGIEGQEEMPSQGVWDAIDNNLDKQNIIRIQKKYRNLKWLSLLLLLLLSTVIFYEIQTKTKNRDFNENNETGSEKKPFQGNSIINPSNKSVDHNRLKQVDNGQAGLAAIKNLIAPSGKANGNTITPVTLPALQSKPATAHKSSKSDGKPENVSEKKSLLEKSQKFTTNITIKNSVPEASIAAEAVISNLQTNAAANAYPLPYLVNTFTGTVDPEVINKQTALSSPGKKMVLPVTENKSLISMHQKTKQVKDISFSIIPFFAPQFTFNRIENDQHENRQPGSNGPRNDRETIKTAEPRGASSYMAGVITELSTGKKISFQGGIGFLYKSTAILPKKIYASPDNDGKVKYRFDCSSGYTYISPKTGAAPLVGDSATVSSSTNTLQYIGLPLAVKYNFALRKLIISPQLGTAANILVKQKIETELSNNGVKEAQTIHSIEGLKPVYFNGLAGISFEYGLGKHAAISVTPAGNFALSSINKNGVVKSYPNSFGISGGVKIKL